MNRIAAFLVASFAIAVALFHNGYLRRLWALQARWADPFGNLWWAGMSPAYQGSTPWRYTYDQLPSLDGKVALVTGGNSGLGFWTSFHLARKGASVYVGCRNEDKCTKAVGNMKSEIERREPGLTARLHTAILDTSSIASVKSFSEKFLAETERLDILVLNAGILMTDKARSVDGIDPMFATNHVGHQLLYTLFEDRIARTSEETKDARVVVVSSTSHYDSYEDGVALTREELNRRWDVHRENPWDLDRARGYPQSKLANTLFAQEAALRNRDKHVYVNSLHPGAVSTEIMRNAENELEATTASQLFFSMIDYFRASMWTPEQGALTQVYLAAAGDVADRDVRGRYFHPQAMEVMPCSRFAWRLDLQKKLWNFTEELIAGRG